MSEPPATFAGLLRQLRTEAGLTQEELAAESGVSLRSVSDLERGVVAIPHRDTVRLLADALHLTGPARVEFETAGRGLAASAGVAAATRTLPRDIPSFTGRSRGDAWCRVRWRRRRGRCPVTSPRSRDASGSWVSWWRRRQVRAG